MDKIRTNKLLYLEGIRGVAALMVFFYHLGNTFDRHLGEHIYYYLKSSTNSYFISHVVHSLLNILLDGNLAVYIFWFMSGYVISIKLFKDNHREYLRTAFSKRYIRLALPCLGSVLFAYLLLKFGLLYHIELSKLLGANQTDWMVDFYNFSPDFLTAIKSGLWDTFFNFNFDSTYNIVLWTMQHELYGSFLCFFLFGIFGTISKRYYAYIIITAVLFFINSYLVTFVLGFFLSDVDNTNNKLKNSLTLLERIFFSKWYFATVFFLILAILAGSNLWEIPNIILSALLVFTVMRSEFLQLFFQSRPLVWLGKISFSLYLLHVPVICSLGCFLYLQLDFPPATKALLASGSTIVVVLLLSVVYTKYIDNFSVKFSNKIAKAFTKK